MITFAMIAGGLVVMKSKASPLIPIPSLSTKNSGQFVFGGVIERLNSSLRIWDHSKVGITGETSAPVVVVPIEPLPVYKIKMNLVIHV